MANISLQNVCKNFGEVEILKNVTLEILDGEFVALIGPSGCGKSTALKILAGLEAPTSGNVGIDDADVTDLSPGDRDIAMVFQNYALYPHLTVRKNLGFGLKMRKRSKAEIAQKVGAAAELLSIAHLLDRYPRALSGGQRQRVALGRAIVREPRAFLMDEPLSNLDAKLRVEMRNEITALHDRINATTVYVTHDQTEAMTMADRIVVLLDGEVQQCGTPQTLYNFPANVFVAGFIGSPSMNFFRGSIVHNESNCPAISFGGSVKVPYDADRHKPCAAGPVIIGFRPEHVEHGHRAGTVQLSVRPHRVEDLGMEKQIYFRLPTEEGKAPFKTEHMQCENSDNGELLARVFLDQDVRCDTDIQLCVEPKYFYLFDAITQAAL